MPGRSRENAPEGLAGAKAEGTATIARRLVGDLFAGAGGSPAATPELEVIAGADPGQRLALGEIGRPYLVGRGAGCALSLVVDEISREHAVFVWTAEGVLVRDLGSKNGVLVAGARIASEQRLHHGDLVEIGPVTLRLRDPVDRYLTELEASPSSPSSSPGPEVAVAAAEPPPALVASRGSRAGIILICIALAVLVAAAAAAYVLFVE